MGFGRKKSKMMVCHFFPI